MNEFTVKVKRNLKSEREAAAKEFQENMAAQGCFVVRLLSSPGSGKTSLLEKTAARLATAYSVGILVGDVETERDAERLAPYAPTKQITTGGACHLELPLIKRALPQLGEEKFEFLFIEDIRQSHLPSVSSAGRALTYFGTQHNGRRRQAGQVPQSVSH